MSMLIPFTRFVKRLGPRVRAMGLLLSLAVVAIALAGAAEAAVSTLGKSKRALPLAAATLPATSGGGANVGPTLPPFSFRDQQGQLVANRDLLGHVWIADLIYTSCTSACPLLTARLVTVQRRLRDPRLGFVSFSVDPSQDTPAVLASYAKRWNENEPRWRLLSTDAAGLAQLTSSMQVEVSVAAGEIVHSDRFFLIDAEGKVANSFDSADDAAVGRLIAEAGQLLGAAPSATIAGTSGAELFSALGCAGCHDDARLAPPLAGLLGTHVMLERGAPVVADDEYIRESILSPGAQLVAGYPSSMPAYGAMLSSSQLTALVGYVHTLHGAHLAAAAAASQMDPVCGMPTRVTKDTPSAEYHGEIYHFCSTTCARQFRANPAKYVREK